jgi:hypothetical protein
MMHQPMSSTPLNEDTLIISDMKSLRSSSLRKKTRCAMRLVK